MACCRERNDGLYTALTYLSAKLIEEVIVALLVSIIAANIVFWACKFAGSWALFWFTAFLTTVVGIGARTPLHKPCLPTTPPFQQTPFPSNRPPAFFLNMRWTPACQHACSRAPEHLRSAVKSACCRCAVLGYFIAAISPNMDVANGALPAWVVINLFFVGLLIQPVRQPDYWCAANASYSCLDAHALAVASRVRESGDESSPLCAARAGTGFR